MAVDNSPRRRAQLKFTCIVIEGRNSLAAIENVGKDEKGAAGPSSAQQKLGDKSQMPSGHVQR